MSPCKPLNDQALMPLPIITIGVLITTTILLFSVVSIFDNHPMKIETELETIGSILNQKIQSVDTFCFEQKIQWIIPNSMNTASIFLTPNSIIIKEQSGNKEYMASAQPSVIYQATINLSRPHEIFQMKLIGHGHYAGADGKLYTDISTLTDALQITKIISVSIR